MVVGAPKATKTCGALALALLASLGAARGQQTNTATTEVARQDPASWALDCQGAAGDATGSCQVSQSITVRETGQRIMMVVVQKDFASSATHMLLALPHRIHLPSGIAVTVDANAAHRMQVETCDERACYASVEMDGAFLDEMRGGAHMDIVFSNLAQKPVTVAVPLDGFDGTYDRLP
jgi:invasion protein IalB